jgi:RNA polymerase sigma-70 factor (ECF subfamily)
MPSRRAARRLDPPSASDEDLIDGCLRGDERSWNELIDRYAAYIYAVAQRAYGLDAAAADEVFQDTCIRVYSGLRGYTGRGQFRSWLRAVVLSACREHIRTSARAQPEILEPGQESDLDSLERALVVREAVAGLGEPCKTTIELHFFHDLTQAEVARRLAVPEGTIAARVSRCVRRLRDALQEPSPAGTSRG